MSDKLGQLEYDLTIDEKQLDKDIKSIDAKLKAKSKDWEKYLSVDFSKATKGALLYQKILQAQNATESKRLIAVKNISAANERAGIAAKRSAEVSRRAATSALLDEQKLAAAKSRTAAAQVRLEAAQKRTATQAGRTSSAYKKQGLALQNLNTLAASYASIFAVARIANKIREVTGEFELQNKALAAILGNKEKADQLFGQVTELALKSPFAIKELLTFTKQLAAYRIETESLIPTLTQLADVSAGLGVDMSRLILAYGQVRAASVLRGTELRQFTEAGIPLVQLLADKFSILEGRVVDTNEVFDKISNRMVSFAMVSEVFQEMTEQGGLFFEAQAVQAKTLAGMWNILGDAIDKAMFQIGTNNEGILKGAVQGATDLTRSWETILSVLKAVVITYGAFRASQILLARARSRNLLLIRNEVTGLNQLTFAQRRANLEQLKAVSVSHRLRTALRGIKGALGGLAFGALLGIASALYDAYIESNRFNKELQAISDNELIRGNKLVDGFEDMAKAAKDAADGSKDQRDALITLNRVYKDYLPNQILSIDGLNKLTDGYDSVTDAINRKVEAQAREKGLAAIEEEFRGREAERTEALVQSLVGDDKLSEEAARVFANNFKKSFNEAIEKGEPFNAFTELNKQLNEFTGKDVTSQFSDDLLKGFGSIQGNARAFIGVLEDVTEAQDNLNNQLAGKFRIPTGQYTEEINALTKFKDEYEATIKEIKDTGDLTDTQVDEQKLDAQKDQLESVIQLYKDLSAQAFIAGDSTGKVNYFSQKIEDAELALSKLIVTQDAYRASIEDIIEAEGTEKGFGKIFNVTEQEDIIKHQKRIAEAYARINSEIDITEKALIRLNKEEKDTTAINSKIERLKIEKAIAKAIIDAYGIKLKAIKGDSTELNNLKARLKLLTDIKKAREDLSKTLSAEKVEDSIQKLFGVQAADLGIVIPITSDTTAFYAQLQDLVVQAEALGTKGGDALAKSFSAKIANLQVKDITNAAKDALKALDVEIKDAKGKYDFYKDVLGITGDEEIALKFGIDKDAFTDVLKKATEDVAKEFGIEGTFEDIAGLDNLPEEVAKKVLAVNNILEKSTKDSILDKLKFLEKIIPEGIGLEFDFSEIITELSKKSKEIRSEVTKAIVSADDDEKKLIEAKGELEIKAVNEIARQRAEKIGGAYIKEQLEIKQLGNAYSNMTDASLKDIEKILEALKESKDDLLSEDGIAAILSRASISGTAETSFFSGLSDSANIDEFLLKLGEIESEVSNIDELRIGDEIIDQEQLGKLRAVIEVFQAMGIAVKNATESTEDSRLTKQIAEWKKFGKELEDLISVAEELGETFGINLSDNAKAALEGIKATAVGVMALITQTAILSAGAVKGVEKASVILAVIGAALQIIQGIATVLKSVFSSDGKFEQQIEDEQAAIDELSRAYNRLERAKDDAVGAESFVNIQSQIANMDTQIRAMYRQIDAERNKKDTDYDAIQDYDDAIEELKNKQVDLIKELQNELLGIDLKSAAEEFGDALVDAFLAGEDAASAFGQTFDDILRNAIVNNFKVLFLEKALQPLFDQMASIFTPASGNEAEIAKLQKELADLSQLPYFSGSDLAKQTDAKRKALEAQIKALSEVTNVTDEAEMQKLLDLASQAQEDGLEQWGQVEDLLNKLGLGPEADDLGSLAKGITGITEDTARRLEAITNSIRETGIDSNSKLGSLVAIVNSQSLIASQSIAQLQQLNNTALSIQRGIESVMTNAQNTGGTGFKVYMQ